MLTEELTRVVLPICRFEGVNLAAGDVGRVAAFWRAVLAGTLHPDGPGRLRISPAPGRPETEIVRVTAAPDLSPERDRVHLDVRMGPAGVHELMQAGARLIRPPGHEPWYVLADPEENEFCAYPASDARPRGIFELVVKCRDAHRLARWWSRILGGKVAEEGEAAVITSTPDFPWDFMVFDPVREPKRAPNRMHWHVRLRDPDPGELIDAGAEVLRQPDVGERHWILADPEGNEFCAYPPTASF